MYPSESFRIPLFMSFQHLFTFLLGNVQPCGFQIKMCNSSQGEASRKHLCFLFVSRRNGREASTIFLTRRLLLCWAYGYAIVLRPHARSCQNASILSRHSPSCWDYNYVIVLRPAVSK